MKNPILTKRIEVCKTIMKSFADDNSLEKAQYVHKYIRKEMTKNGKARYIYAQPRNVERIKGKKKMLGNGKEITLKSKTLMPYTDEMKEELGKEILSLDGVSKLYWSNSNSTESNYLKFKKGDIKFKVRISSHTQSTERNAVMFPMEYREDLRLWQIDANLGHYTPKDVSDVTTTICNLLAKWDSVENIKKLKDFADEHKIEPKDEDEIPNLTYTLAEKYINDKKLKDDKFGSTFQVLKFVSRYALGEILDEERYMADIK